MLVLIFIFILFGVNIYKNIPFKNGNDQIEFILTNVLLLLVMISLFFGLFHKSKKFELGKNKIQNKIRNNIIDWLINSKFNPYIDEDRRKN